MIWFSGRRAFEDKDRFERCKYFLNPIPEHVESTELRSEIEATTLFVQIESTCKCERLRPGRFWAAEALSRPEERGLAARQYRRE